MHPIHIPEEWHDRALLTFEEFCTLIHTPQRTVRAWRQRGVGPRWDKIESSGRLYIRVAEARRYLDSATARPVRGNAR